MAIEEYINHTGILIEQRLAELVADKNVPYHQLFSAARYALLSGGKRIRPLLLTATANVFDYDHTHSLSAACAIEMVHTYSMIHDDLPCMDNDDFRRGKPTLHRAFPEAHAVLTGDYLLTYAFELLVGDPMLSAQQQSALVLALARGSGSDGMVAGQVMDIEAEGVAINPEHLQLIHRYKTGALITAAVEMGAIVGKASKADTEALCGYASALGLAFQIVDDILDVSCSEEKHGKKVSSDVLKDKMTYVKIFGLEGAKAKAYEQVAAAKQCLATVDGDTSLLSKMADRVLQRCPTV
jgi:geranylgeranyl diphosphate synthase type II